MSDWVWAAVLFLSAGGVVMLIVMNVVSGVEKAYDEHIENMFRIWIKAEVGRQVLLGRVEDLETRLEDLRKAYAACNGEDHPAYIAAVKALAELKGQDD